MYNYLRSGIQAPSALSVAADTSESVSHTQFVPSQ